MSGFTYIVTYEHDGGRRSTTHFVAESPDAALHRAAADCPADATVKEVKRSEAQRLCEPFDHTVLRADDTLFSITWEDVEGAAKDVIEGGKPHATDLSEDEMHTFLKCLHSGMECWAEIVQLSLMAATVGRMDAPGAIGRANRFAATGDTNVLLEGFDGEFGDPETEQFS